ncbi:kallikrein-11-like [Thunnus albacares]|uniref:kallikrein-11-like n=1 Tax=Thunnus albacares TaxID=8236 RepID=UPI001CF6A679|nr:kallikrein-11-like [Thunnus albacares]
MLLKMSAKAHFSNTVKPIGLAGQGDGSLPKSCIVSGWGTTSSNTGHMSHRLMEANVTLSDEEQCVIENSYCSQGDRVWETLVVDWSIKMERHTGYCPTPPVHMEVAQKCTIMPRFLTIDTGSIHS